MTDDSTVDERELARSLHAHVMCSGGFTLHRRTHRPLHRGLSVSADPSATLHVPWRDWEDAAVAGWIHRHAERRHQEDLHLGGWLDAGRAEVALDLVHVYPETARREALLTGIHHQQRAVFDIGARSLVCLAGVTAASLDTLLLANALGATG